MRRVPHPVPLTLLLLAALAGGIAVAAPAPDEPRSYDLSGQEITGVRPTAVGLPRVFQGASTVGVPEMAPGLMQYHDSGRYERDLEAVVGAARRYVAQRLDAAAAEAQSGPRPVCTVRYLRTHTRDRRGRRLYLRKRTCRATASPPLSKPAIVLDVDETSLSNYAALQASGFSAAGVVLGTISAADPPIAPTLELFKWAKSRGVAVFFVTGRPESVNGFTEPNLRTAGYEDWDGLLNKTGDKGTVAFKSGARAELEQRGYTILANIGDQESDLAGGHAERAFKLPNPFYFIPE